MSISHFEAHYKQHNAALKYFRMICENHTEGITFSNSHKAAVAAIEHAPGMSYTLDEGDMREWSWWELVAQLDIESMKYVVEDGDDSRGLIGCVFRVRPGSYDHKKPP